MNNKRLVLAAAGLSLAVLSGCVVVPARGYARGGYEPPPGVAYVEPTYASPGPGWAWEYHATYGWGWHHPQYGWHRGWR